MDANWIKGKAICLSAKFIWQHPIHVCFSNQNSWKSSTPTSTFPTHIFVQESSGIKNYFEQIFKPSNQNFVQIPVQKADAKTISEEHWLQFVLWMLAHISICTVAMPRSLGCMPKYWIYGLIQSKLFVGVSMVLPVINKVEC